MTGASDSVITAAAVVPPEVERARRIARLHLHSPGLAAVMASFAFQAAGRIFGISPIVTAAPFLLCLLGAAVVLKIRLGRRPGRAHVRQRLEALSLRDGIVFLLYALVLVAAVAAMFSWERDRPLSTAVTALLMLPGLGFVGLNWWRNRWWPRLALTAAYGLAVALLPLWLPARGGRFAAVELLLFGFGAAVSFVDQWELHRLLRETDREADGDTV